MNALVTGGGGFLGGAIVRMLREQGDEVAVFGRGRYPTVEALGAKCIQGDIRDQAAVRAACAERDVVFHVAAKAGVWGKRSEYRSINVEGTRNVVQACREHGTPRLVYTSTPSVVFDRGDLCGVNESQPYPRRFLNAYAESKAEAERLVLASNGGGLSTVALRPHLIWGPGDPHLIPRILERAREGALVQVGDGTNLVDITYIDNAAHAHVLAADALVKKPACAGKAYFISQGEPVLLWTWLKELLDLAKIEPPRRRISLRTAYCTGAFLELLHTILPLPGEPAMTRFVALQLAKSHYFDISAARRDLGYSALVSTQEGLSRLAASWGEGSRVG